MNTAVAVPSPSPSLLGGPRTPEGKARSAQNARRHGLRARDFGLAADEDPAEWALHLAVCERGYGPVDRTSGTWSAPSPRRCGTRSAPTG